jgi:sigma-B regulation protein RsbU (phosphoserine phosphatase)
MEAHRSLLATLDEQAEQARRADSELKTARGVQQNLFPRKSSLVHDIEYAGRCTPARNVSGDYYDFLPLGAGRLGIVLADVSGKGIPAALLMANLQGCFRTRTQAGPSEPVALLRSINALLYESTSPETFATVFFGDYDSTAHRLHYVNCGHLPPFLLISGNASAERLEPTATVLGAFPDWHSSAAVVDLSPGDTLFAYTDGLTEAYSAQGEEFGDARLGAVLASARGEDPEAILDKVMGAVQGFSTGTQRDDITAVVLRRATNSRQA